MTTPTKPPESYPLPWKAKLVAGRVYDRDGLFVADAADDKALADYIVTAANGYPVLLEAAEEITSPRFLGKNDDLTIVRIQEIARAALDKVGGES